MDEKYFVLELPSKLIPYTGVEKVEARLLKGRDEKLIGELSIQNFETKFATLLKQVIRGIDPEELTIGDRFYILTWLSINCYSNIYPVKGPCELCFRDISVDVDLGQLEKVYLDDTYKEPYELTLTNGETIKLRQFRVKDQIKYMDYVSRKQEDNMSYKLALAVADDREMIERITYLDNLSTKDTGLIRNFHDKFFHGVKMEYSYTCPKCGGAGIMPVPFRLDIIFPEGSTVARSLGRTI